MFSFTAELTDWNFFQLAVLTKEEHHSSHKKFLLSVTLQKFLPRVSGVHYALIHRPSLDTGTKSRGTRGQQTPTGDVLVKLLHVFSHHSFQGQERNRTFTAPLWFQKKIFAGRARPLLQTTSLIILLFLGSLWSFMISGQNQFRGIWSRLFYSIKFCGLHCPQLNFTIPYACRFVWAGSCGFLKVAGPKA